MNAVRHMREATERYLPRIQAGQRIRLRRWLRTVVSLDDQPDGQYLDMDIPDLKRAITEAGGDAESIFDRITDATIKVVWGRS